MSSKKKKKWEKSKFFKTGITENKCITRMQLNKMARWWRYDIFKIVSSIFQ